MSLGNQKKRKWEDFIKDIHAIYMAFSWKLDPSTLCPNLCKLIYPFVIHKKHTPTYDWLELNT